MLAVTFTVVIFGQIKCQNHRNVYSLLRNVYSPLPFLVMLQGGFRSSLFGQVNNPFLLFGIIRPRLLWERIENRLNMQWLALLVSLGHRMTSRECQRESKAQTAKTFVFYPASKRF